jgi:hypothetical protein
MGNNGSHSFWRETAYLAEQRQCCALIDTLLLSYFEGKPGLAEAHAAYRNHCQRVYNYSLYLMRERPENPEMLKNLAIALVFHDIGIWTANTVDYLDPSCQEAVKYCQKERFSEKSISEICEIIQKHHQLLQGSLPDNSLTEIVRRADLVDVSWGFVKHGLPPSVIKEVQTSYPNKGFHLTLLRLFVGRLFSHPLNPAPMMRLTS